MFWDFRKNHNANLSIRKFCDLLFSTTQEYWSFLWKRMIIEILRCIPGNFRNFHGNLQLSRPDFENASKHFRWNSLPNQTASAYKYRGMRAWIRHVSCMSFLNAADHRYSTICTYLYHLCLSAAFQTLGAEYTVKSLKIFSLKKVDSWRRPALKCTCTSHVILILIQWGASSQ